LEYWLRYGTTEVPVAVPDENLIAFLSPLEESTSQSPEQIATLAIQHKVGDGTLHDAARSAKKIAIAFNAECASSSLLASTLATQLTEMNREHTILIESAPDLTQPRSSPELPMRNVDVGHMTVKHDPRSSPVIKVGEIEGGKEVWLNGAFADAEIRCVVANVAVNPFWGYSGGPSLLMPGLASEKTARVLLSSTLKTARLPGVLSGNATYEILHRVSTTTPIDLAIHTVERPDGKLAGAFVGHHMETFQQACALSGQLFRRPIQRKADIVIASAGGSTWDRTLFEVSPSLIMSEGACKDHGILVHVAECPEGVGTLYPPVHRDSRDHPLSGRRSFTPERLLGYSLEKISSEHRVYLASTLPEHQASRYSLLAARSVGNAFQRALRHAGKDASVVMMSNASVTAPVIG